MNYRNFTSKLHTVGYGWLFLRTQRANIGYDTFSLLTTSIQYTTAYITVHTIVSSRVSLLDRGPMDEGVKPSKRPPFLLLPRAPPHLLNPPLIKPLEEEIAYY